MSSISRTSMSQSTTKCVNVTQGRLSSLLFLLVLVPFFGTKTLSQAFSLNFTTPFNISTGVHPHAVLLTDVNGDTSLDLAVVNAGSDTLSIILGFGNGTFQAKVDCKVPSKTEPKAVAFGDLNGDGKLDAVTVNQKGNNTKDVSVFLNKGGGVFQSAVNYQGVAGCHGLAIADMNNDGNLDIVVVGWGGNISAVLWGLGNGSCGSRTVYQTQNAPHSVTIGDFNGDGFKDYATANRGSNSVSVLLSNKTRGFLPQVSYAVGSNPHSIVSADFNKDGKLDLAVANDGSNSVAVLFGKTNGTFKSSVYYTVCTTPKTVIAADVDNDGNLDIIVSCIRNNYPNLINKGGDPVTILHNLGSGTFGNRTDWVFGQGAFSVALGDINSDGKRDLAVANWYDGNVGMRKQL